MIARCRAGRPAAAECCWSRQGTDFQPGDRRRRGPPADIEEDPRRLQPLPVHRHGMRFDEAGVALDEGDFSVVSSDSVEPLRRRRPPRPSVPSPSASRCRPRRRHDAVFRRAARLLATLALATRVLVGVRPVLTQVPPTASRSTMATRRPVGGQAEGEGGAAWPAPITIASMPASPAPDLRCGNPSGAAVAGTRRVSRSASPAQRKGTISAQPGRNRRCRRRRRSSPPARPVRSRV